MPSRVLTVALATAATGCGTMHNMRQDGEPVAYGGVRSDVAFAREHAGSDRAVPAMLFCACDLPLSAVGDTLTLPLAIQSTPSPSAPPTADTAR